MSQGQFYRSLASIYNCCTSWSQAEEKLFGAVADLDLIQVKELLSQGISANAKWVQVLNWPLSKLQLF